MLSLSLEGGLVGKLVAAVTNDGEYIFGRLFVVFFTFFGRAKNLCSSYY